MSVLWLLLLLLIPVMIVAGVVYVIYSQVKNRRRR
jgi:hypothetical protein